MAKLLPFKPELPSRDSQPRLVDLDDETADDVFAALSSETARDIVSQLYDEPATASDIAESVDTSLQNARYHLDQLQSAGVIEPVDTWYSSRGTEMTVYAPTNEPLVVAAGKEESTGVLREALMRMVSAVAILGIVSLLVDRWARQVLSRAVSRTADAAGGADLAPKAATTTETMADGGAGGGAEDGEMVAVDGTNTTTPTPEPEATATVTETTKVAERATGTPAPTPTETAQLTEATTSPPPTTAVAGADPGLIGGVPPGALFFAGGVLVILLVAGWWYAARYRPLYG